MNLVFNQNPQTGARSPVLICNEDEKARFEKFLGEIANYMDFCDKLGLEKEWFALYDKLADIDLELRETKDDMSTARPEVL